MTALFGVYTDMHAYALLTQVQMIRHSHKDEKQPTQRETQS